MSTFLMDKPGRVVRLEDPTVQCTSYFSVDDHPRFESERSIVNRVTGGYAVNLQALSVVGDGLYVYVFGDKPSGIEFSGFSFCACDGTDGHGVSLMLDWWKRNRASQRSTPIQLVVGRQVISGVLKDFRHDVVSLEHNLASWSAFVLGAPE